MSKEKKKISRRGLLAIFGISAVTLCGAGLSNWVSPEHDTITDSKGELGKAIFKKIYSLYNDAQGISDEQRKQYAENVTATVLKIMAPNIFGDIKNVIMSGTLTSIHRRALFDNPDIVSYKKLAIDSLFCDTLIINGINAGTLNTYIRGEHKTFFAFDQVLADNKFPTQHRSELTKMMGVNGTIWMDMQRYGAVSLANNAGNLTWKAFGGGGSSPDSAATDAPTVQRA